MKETQRNMKGKKGIWKGNKEIWKITKEYERKSKNYESNYRIKSLEDSVHTYTDYRQVAMC